MESSSLQRDRDRDRSHLGSASWDPSGQYGDSEGPIVFSRRHDFDFEDVFGGPPKKSIVYEHRGSVDETMWDPSIGRDSVGGEERSDFFGECSSPCSTRRKDLVGDFFSDIFRGSESSACSTPRTGMDQDSVSNTRVISPVNSLPPRTESCVGSPSPSSKLSLLKKKPKERDDKNEDSSYLDAKQVAEAQSELKSNNHALFHPSSLPSHNSHHKDSSGSKVKVEQFHFSIYKWATKGVMLATPSTSTSKERSRYNGRLRGLPVPFLQGPDIPSSNKITPTSHHTESGIQDDTQEIFPMDSAFMADIILEPEKKDNKLDEDREDFLSYTSPTGSAEGPVDFTKKNTKKSLGDETIAQDVPVELEENIQIDRVKGKVKNFIKIFNEDHSRSQSNKLKYIRKAKVKEDVKTQTTKEYVENIYNRDVESIAHVVPPAYQFEQVLKEERVQSDVNFDVLKEFESFDEGRRGPTQSFESEAPYTITEVIHYEVEEFMVEELEEHNEPLQLDSDFKNFQKSDAKLQTWSAEKQGNIRSLLSTLQYVLWEGSGWKPVALVDIIESSSVKKIYQKALLQLHPDKLQQRGASTQQKYIAEKVFSILQEAWDHFNTLSAL